MSRALSSINARSALSLARSLGLCFFQKLSIDQTCSVPSERASERARRAGVPTRPLTRLVGSLARSKRAQSWSVLHIAPSPALASACALDPRPGGESQTSSSRKLCHQCFYLSCTLRLRDAKNDHLSVMPRFRSCPCPAMPVWPSKRGRGQDTPSEGNCEDLVLECKQGLSNTTSRSRNGTSRSKHPFSRRCARRGA